MALGNSILGQLGSAVGISSNASNNSISNAQIDMYNATMQQMTNQAQAARSKPMYNFSFEELENGWLIIHAGRKWMVNDLEELGQRVVAIMVEQKLEK